MRYKVPLPLDPTNPTFQEKLYLLSDTFHTISVLFDKIYNKKFNSKNYAKLFGEFKKEKNVVTNPIDLYLSEVVKSDFLDVVSVYTKKWKYDLRMKEKRKFIKRAKEIYK